jgi:hypothetical protein
MQVRFCEVFTGMAAVSAGVVLMAPALIAVLALINLRPSGRRADGTGVPGTRPPPAVDPLRRHQMPQASHYGRKLQTGHTDHRLRLGFTL